MRVGPATAAGPVTVDQAIVAKGPSGRPGGPF